MTFPSFHSFKEKKDFYVKTTVATTFVLVFLYYLIPLTHSTRVTNFVDDAGLLGPLLLILFFTIADVTLPLLGSPGIILSVSLYGLVEGLFIAYVASLISATINFYLSRKYGKELIRKLGGKHLLQQVEFYTERFGLRTLILGRLFGFPIFEVISYAGGLAPMSFRTYMLITVIFGAVPAFTFKTLIFFANMQSSFSILLWTCILSLVGALSAYLVNKIIEYLQLEK